MITKLTAEQEARFPESPMTILHPEHGDWVLPAGCYAISYQRTEDSEGRQRRVKD